MNFVETGIHIHIQDYLNDNMNFVETGIHIHIQDYLNDMI